MEPSVIFYSVQVKAGAWARVFLNDLPLHEQDAPGVDSHSSSINELLVHGENTLTVEVLTAPPERGPGAVSVHFYTVIDWTTKPMTIAPVHGFSFPENAVEAMAPDRKVPYLHTSTFVLDRGGFVPAWIGADIVDFDCGGTPELRAAVLELHLCVEQLDIDRFLELSELRLSEYERAHPGIPPARADTRRDALRELFSYKPKIPPLEMDSLHFEPRAGGRVAYVRRAGGGYVLNAPTERDPRRRLKANLLFIRRQGTWNIWG